jgi:hypothetical protein
LYKRSRDAGYGTNVKMNPPQLVPSEELAQELTEIGMPYMVDLVNRLVDVITGSATDELDGYTELRLIGEEMREAIVRTKRALSAHDSKRLEDELYRLTRLTLAMKGVSSLLSTRPTPETYVGATMKVRIAGYALCDLVDALDKLSSTIKVPADNEIYDAVEEFKGLVRCLAPYTHITPLRESAYEDCKSRIAGIVDVMERVLMVVQDQMY